MNFLNAIEQSILDDKDISLKSFVEQFKATNQGFELLNKHVILIHLYGSIVLPWESLKKKLPKKIMMSEIDPEEWGYFKIMNHNTRHPIHKMDLRFFLRKLRNSISHNNAFVNDDKSVIFRDRDGSKIKYEWEDLLKLMEISESHHPNKLANLLTKNMVFFLRLNRRNQQTQSC